MLTDNALSTKRRLAACHRQPTDNALSTKRGGVPSAAPVFDNHIVPAIMFMQKKMLVLMAALAVLTAE